MRVKGWWKGEIASIAGKSQLIASSQQSPLKVAKPLRDEQDRLLIYLMDSSPGLFNGDLQEIHCKVGEGACVFLTNQSSSKLHPSPKVGKSKQIQRFTVQGGGFLCYFPEPIIPLQQANHESDTEIHIASGGAAFLSEIIAPGRLGYGECFAYQRFSSQLSVYWDGEWAVWDSYCLEPERDNNLSPLGPYTHVGTLWVLSEEIGRKEAQATKDCLYAMEEKGIYAGCSMLEKNGIVIRFLGNSSWSIKEGMEQCKKLFSIPRVLK